jgi:hypothetical protein
MSTRYRSIYLTKKMSREDAEAKLAEIDESIDALRLAATNPDAAASMTISAGGGTKSVTQLSPEQRIAQLEILTADHDALSWRLGLIPSLPGSSVRTFDVTFDRR